jgi:hypothetical protein
MTQEQQIVDLAKRIRMWKDWSDRAIAIIREQQDADPLETTDIAVQMLELDYARLRYETVLAEVKLWSWLIVTCGCGLNSGFIIVKQNGWCGDGWDYYCIINLRGIVLVGAWLCINDRQWTQKVQEG